jgi:SAM-dependent methyltransferase
MLSTEAQVARRALICPRTRQPLVIRNGVLTTADGLQTYPIENGVPILFLDDPQGDCPTPDSQPDEHAAGPRRLNRVQLAMDRLLGFVGDQRSRASQNAWGAFTSKITDDELYLAVGGGPTRFHPDLVNLNIEAFDNVDIVGDAHYLPYENDSVSATQIEAVLEHVEEPDKVVQEMFRVLRPGGEAYSVTPFLQGFHGYPSHYFNLTREGHRLVFERAGFEVISDGACVGPSWMIQSLLVEYVGQLVPVRGLRALAMTMARVLLLPLPLIDRFMNQTARAHVLASTTFVYARKP